MHTQHQSFVYKEPVCHSGKPYEVSIEKIALPVQPGFLSGLTVMTDLPKEHSAEKAVAFIFNHAIAFAGTRF